MEFFPVIYLQVRVCVLGNASLVWFAFIVRTLLHYQTSETQLAIWIDICIGFLDQMVYYKQKIPGFILTDTLATL